MPLPRSFGTLHRSGRIVPQTAHMRTKAEILEQLQNPGVIAVVRAQRQDTVEPLANALLAGGIRAIEITMTTPNALEAIRNTTRALGSDALVGVGTVLDANTCRAAIEAGAEFVVTPILRPEIADIANRAGRAVMLGAYTPTEAQLAHEAGADFVKIFPADGLGPAYIKNLRAPLPHLKIVPTGGVNLQTITAFFKAGCSAVGVGSSLMAPELIQSQDWPGLTRLAQEYTRLARECRPA